MRLKRAVGKTIARIEMNPFRAEPENPHSRRMAHDPVIVFTDGSSMRFVVQETETGEYGIMAILIPKARSKQ